MRRGSSPRQLGRRLPWGPGRDTAVAARIFTARLPVGLARFAQFAHTFPRSKHLIRHRDSTKITIPEKVIFVDRSHTRESPRHLHNKVPAGDGRCSVKPDPPLPRFSGARHPIFRYTMSNIEAVKLESTATMHMIIVLYQSQGIISFAAAHRRMFAIGGGPQSTHRRLSGLPFAVAERNSASTSFWYANLNRDLA